MKDKRSTAKKILLIDDDRGFSAIMCELAISKGYDLESYASLADLGSIGMLIEYDGAILDYDLGTEGNGLEIAQCFKSFFNNRKPVVLISGKLRQKTQHGEWPSSIRGFMHKDRGPQAILDKMAGCFVA